MKIRYPALGFAMASLLVLSACDNRDYEGEIATLQADLDTARGEAEQLQTEVDELRTQAEGAPAQDALENAKTELNSAIQTAAATFERMGALNREPDAPAEARTEALDALRQDMQQIVQSVETAAQDLGIEIETVELGDDAAAGDAAPADAPASDGSGAQQPAADSTEQPADSSSTEQPATSEETPADENSNSSSQ